MKGDSPELSGLVLWFGFQKLRLAFQRETIRLANLNGVRSKYHFEYVLLFPDSRMQIWGRGGGRLKLHVKYGNSLLIKSS